MKRRLLLCQYTVIAAFIVLIFAPAEGRGEISVEAALSHLSFSLAGRAELSLTVHGASQADIELPEIDGIQLSSRGQSRQIAVRNGEVSSAVVHTYQVEASRPGEYTIPPIKVSAAGDTLRTVPLHFTVTKDAPAHLGGDNQIAMLEVTATGDHYPGEAVPIEIKAYFRRDHRVELHSLPSLQGDGVIMPPLRDTPRQEEEVRNGQRYHLLNWKTTLTGVKAGRHQLFFQLDASLLTPRSRRSPGALGGGGLFDSSPFNDPFFDSFLGNSQRQRLQLTSPTITFNVIPLPDAGQPADFSGSVGDFQLQVTAQPLTVDPGEPISLRIAISGQGNFEGMEAPAFPDHPGWKSYPPTAEFSASPEGDGFSGEKVFTRAIVAGSEELTAIPTISFSYFDPRERVYKTLFSDSIPITVRPGGLTAPPPPPLPRNTPAKLQEEGEPLLDLAPIRLESGPFTAEIIPYFLQTWYLATFALSLFALLALFVAHLLRHRLAGLGRRRQRRRQLATELEQLAALGDNDHPDNFLTAAKATIARHLGEHYGLEPAALTLADLEQRLPANSPLLALFSAAEEVAYGGGSRSGGNGPGPWDRAKLASCCRELRQELEALQ